MQLESPILYYSLAMADFIGQILSVVVLIALLIPLKGSTRSVIYALGSVISFCIGGIVAGWMFWQYPHPQPVIVIGWHNILGVLFGYLILILDIFQYRRDHTKQLFMESS